MRRWNLKAEQVDTEEHQGAISAAACAPTSVEEHVGTRSTAQGVPQCEGRGTEQDGVALQLAQALTAAIAAQRWELANRILAEIEARRGEGSQAPVVDLAEERAKRGGP